MAMFVKRFKKFMKKNNIRRERSQKKSFSSNRRVTSNKTPETTHVDLCYNYRRPGHFAKECPYPPVKKYTIEERQDRRDRRREEKGKALVGESDKGKEIESEESESEDDYTSSSDIEALYCNIFKY